MSAKKKLDKHHAANADRLFESVVKAFANVRHVTQEKTNGFGSGSLKVNWQDLCDVIVKSSIRREIV